MPHALIALGSNLGDRRRTLEQALAQLAALPQTQLLAQSGFHETPPIGGPAGQQAFLNAAARLETELAPAELLAELQRIERELGRQRNEHWAARTLDLDLLLYDAVVLRTPHLTLPHPRLAFRRFMLDPAAEIAGDLLHPTSGWTLAALRRHLDEACNYVAITGPPASGKTYLASYLHQRFPGAMLQAPPSAAERAEYLADPLGPGRAMALGFLERRAAQLDSANPPLDASEWLISDYWFEQTPAFAHALSADQQAEIAARAAELRPHVMRPKLLIALDAPADELQRRIVARGRSYERDVSVEDLELTRQALIRLLDQPGHGPILRIDTLQTAPRMEEEAVAALESMLQS